MRTVKVRMSSAGNTRGLIEAARTCERPDPARRSSAGNTRGLIEAGPARRDIRGLRASSAGNTRGLIEALTPIAEAGAHPPESSAGNTRGLIEAAAIEQPPPARVDVFRGEYPRPH